jgi:hypothetical protein
MSRAARAEEWTGALAEAGLPITFTYPVLEIAVRELIGLAILAAGDEHGQPVGRSPIGGRDCDIAFRRTGCRQQPACDARSGMAQDRCRLEWR